VYIFWYTFLKTVCPFIVIYVLDNHLLWVCFKKCSFKTFFIYVCSAYKLNKYIQIDSMFPFYYCNNYKDIQNLTKKTNCYIYGLSNASICNWGVGVRRTHRVPLGSPIIPLTYFYFWLTSRRSEYQPRRDGTPQCLAGNCENWQSSSIHKDIIDIIRYPYSHQYKRVIVYWSEYPDEVILWVMYKMFCTTVLIEETYYFSMWNK